MPQKSGRAMKGKRLLFCHCVANATLPFTHSKHLVPSSFYSPEFQNCVCVYFYEMGGSFIFNIFPLNLSCLHSIFIHRDLNSIPSNMVGSARVSAQSFGKQMWKMAGSVTLPNTLCSLHLITHLIPTSKLMKLLNIN